MPNDHKPVGTTRGSMTRIKRVCDRVEGRAISSTPQRRPRHIVAAPSTPAGDDFPTIKVVGTTALVFGNVIGYGDPLDPPPAGTAKVPTFLAAAPTADKPFAVLLQGGAAGEVLLAAPVGVVAVQVNLTDAQHGQASCITNDYTKLVSAASGAARIVWRANQHLSGPATLGVQWARVLLGAAVASEDIRGWSTAIIPAAMAVRDVSLTPGVGNARLATMPTGAAGVAWQAGDTVTVENWMLGTIAAYKPLLLRKSRVTDSGVTIYTVVSEGCATIPSG